MAARVALKAKAALVKAVELPVDRVELEENPDLEQAALGPAKNLEQVAAGPKDLAHRARRVASAPRVQEPAAARHLVAVVAAVAAPGLDPAVQVAVAVRHMVGQATLL